MSNRLLPACLLAAALLTASCTEIKAPTAFTACSPVPPATVPAKATDKQTTPTCNFAVPNIRPDFHSAPKVTGSGTLTIAYDDASVAAGAPEHLPPFAARLHVKGDSIDLALSAKNVSIWHVNVTPNTVQESRHPLLDSNLHAKALIRDITFTTWPLKSLVNILARTCPDCRVSESNGIRTLSRDGVTLLEMKRSDGITTLRNYPEGYLQTFTPDTKSHKN